MPPRVSASLALSAVAAVMACSARSAKALLATRRRGSISVSPLMEMPN